MRFGWWRDPMWRRAPLLLVRQPTVALAIGLTALLLGLTAAAGPLFLDSAGNAAIADELEQLPPHLAGYTVQTLAHPGPAVAEAGALLDAEVAARVPALGEPTRMLLTPAVTVRPAGEADHPGMRVRLLARSGAEEAVTVLATAPAVDGISLQEGVVASLGVEPGDDVMLGYGDRRHTVPVARTFEDLLKGWGGLPWPPPLSAYWARLDNLILPKERPGGDIEVPPALVLVPPDLLYDVAAGLRLNLQVHWEYPLPPAERSLDEVRRVAAAYAGLDRVVRSRETPLGDALRGIGVFTISLDTSTSLPRVLAGVDAAVTGLAPPVRTLSLAAVGIALATLGAAAVFRFRRRRAEHLLLDTRGASAAAQAVRAGVEAGPLVAVASVGGWWLASALVRAVGPSALLGPAATRAALGEVVPAALAGVVLLVVATGVVVVREARVDTPRLGRIAARMPWEAVALSLAAAALYQLHLRGSAIVDGDQPRVDVLLLLFPLLLLAGMVGLALRGIRRTLPSARRWGTNLPVAPYLATRRLAGAPATALLLVGAAAMSLGMLVYAGALAGSAERTLLAKAQTSVGSDVAAPLPRGTITTTLDGATVVQHGRAVVSPGNVRVEILAVDPDTFPAVAHWDDRFAQRPLPDLLEALRRPAGEHLPVLVAGPDVTRDATLGILRYSFLLDPVATLEGFPSQPRGRTVVVVDQQTLLAAIGAQERHRDPGRVLDSVLWARGDTERVEAYLAANAVAAGGLTSVAEVARSPAVRTLRWTLGYLNALGLLAGLLALAATLLYLHERQRSREVSYVLASGMGLRRTVHRRAIALELAGMLATAFAVGGALALLAALLVVPRLDLLPEFAPPPLLALPTATLLGLAAAVAAGCWVGAWAVQASADRAGAAEVLRVAE